MNQTNSLTNFGLGFLLAAGIALLLVLSMNARAQSDAGAEMMTAGEEETAVTQATNINTAITYQGTLATDGSSATGAYDFRFRLFDALNAGNQLGEVTKSNVSVSDGQFIVELDFRQNASAADATWLEIAVRPNGGGSHETLTPRQAITAAPLAHNLPNVYTNPSTGFVGVGIDTPITNFTQFSIHSPTSNNWGGMFMSTSGAAARPFFGYAPDNEDTSKLAWHEYNGSQNEWQLYVNSGVPAISVAGASAGITLSDDVEVNGDISQSLANDGAVKASVYAQCSQSNASINRYFNNVNDSAITITDGTVSGRCTIDFGFDISQRFWTTTAVFGGASRIVSCDKDVNDNEKLNCIRTSPDGAGLNGGIMVSLH